MFLKSNDQYLIKKYTVKNKNIENLERIMKKKMYHNREIKLYHKVWNEFYFPHWAKNLIKTESKEYNRIEISFNWTLKEIQEQALYHILINWGGLIDMKTWSWKSFLVMWIIDLYKTSTLIVVPTTKLLIEMKDKIKTFMNYDCWLRYGKEKNIKDITITTSKSYLENDLWKFSNIIIDECDTNISERLRAKLIMSDCDILVGMTWTPNRVELSTEDLELFFWPICSVWWYQEKPTETIQYVYRWTWEEECEFTWDCFAETRNLVILNEKRTKTIIEKLLEIKQKYNIMLILTDRVEECEILQSLIEWSVIIHWKTKLKDDNKHIETIRKDWWVIIWTRQKMWRWVDVPEIDCVCMVWAFKFKSAVIQSIWRALRTFDGKNNIWVYFFSDTILKSQMYENKKTVENEYWVYVKREFLN